MGLSDILTKDQQDALVKTNSAASNATPTVTSADTQTSEEFNEIRMPLFDTRVYKRLRLYVDGKFDDSGKDIYYPHFDYDSYLFDVHESPAAIQHHIDELADTSPQKDALKKRKEFVENFVNDKNKQIQALASRSFVHPYALIKLAGAYGNQSTARKTLTYDFYQNRKFYEIDGDPSFAGNYSKTPTTTALIRWGAESPRNTTPYSFQDFVFCKHWNRIENNRLITLRRYAAPVTDNLEFPDYEIEADTGAGGSDDVTEAVDDKGKVSKFRGRYSNKPWTPLATAVTYFGDDTGNKLSDILAFKAGYKWDEANTGEGKNPIYISAAQSDGGNLLNNNSPLPAGLAAMSKFLGFLGEVQNGMTMNLDGAPSNIPPDPYENGPYENRILGPINVITKTYKRGRGLIFDQNSLSIKFEYVARPIAGVNSKAILLDLMSNILLMCYSTGSWFGGMWKYRTEGPSIYPFKYGNAMNKVYRGELFGPKGAASTLVKDAFHDGGNLISTFIPDALSTITGMFNAAVDAVKGLVTGDPDAKSRAKASFNEVMGTGTMGALQKVIAAKILRGSTIPYIRDQRALLTGEPVGDWHLTIGNPLNPIATIGNLIVKDVSIKLSDELGPDDFPIGFEATVQLAHGMGRDREGIESMFNRGHGRIYSLPAGFRSSADGETKVDAYTGYSGSEGRLKYDETRNTYFGGGTRFLVAMESSSLANKGTLYGGDTLNMKSLKPTDTMATTQTITEYCVTPWQMGMTL